MGRLGTRLRNYLDQRVDTTERQVDRKKRKAIRWWFVSIRHGRHVLSQCPKQRHSPPGNIKKCLLIPGEMLLFRALANNMAPMTNHDECWRITDESPYAFLTEHFSLSSFYSLPWLTLLNAFDRPMNTLCTYLKEKSSFRAKTLHREVSRNGKTETKAYQYMSVR